MGYTQSNNLDSLLAALDYAQSSSDDRQSVELHYRLGEAHQKENLYQLALRQYLLTDSICQEQSIETKNCSTCLVNIGRPACKTTSI